MRMGNSLSHTPSSDSEQGGNSMLERGPSINEGESNEIDGGAGGANAIPVAPVARQTTLVLQGFFTEEARLNNPDVSEHFSRLQGAGMTAADDEALYQLGLEMHRASLQLRERYSTDFEGMMGELGTSLSEIFEGLSEIAARLFQNPTEISWSRILTFFSFAAWVLIKKGLGFVERALKQAQDLLSKLTSMLAKFNVFSWITRMGGWTANKSHLTNEAELDSDENDGAISRILHEPSNYNTPPGPDDPNLPGAGSSYWYLGGAAGTAAIVVGVAAFFVYKKLK